MKQVVRSQHITILTVQVVNLNTEKVETIEWVLDSWFTSDKIMITKLTDILQDNNYRLISIKEKNKCIRTYTQSLAYFKANAETVTDTLYKLSTKEKEKN